jgi:hypothetical protein
MGLRKSYWPLRPDLDDFLFAEVGAERDGIPLSMVSALTRLGLDPWNEAGRLSTMNKREAVEQLARLIAELPGACRPLAEAREIAADLIERLPRHDGERAASRMTQIRLCYQRPSEQRGWRFWVVCLVLAAAAAISIIVHGGFPFGGG